MRSRFADCVADARKFNSNGGGQECPPHTRHTVLITRQGLPTATRLAGMSRTTTLPAPMTLLSPIVTPGQMRHRPPSQTDASCINLWNSREDVAKLTKAPPIISTVESHVLDILSM